jgi:hypothetical protein
MRQIVNIKKVSVDSELKAVVQLEFIASDRTAKENIFELIQMQGDAAEVIITPSQLLLPEITKVQVEEACI